ncbi:AraC family transcriptional regulator [Crassaminicella profunda]|uniref:AraC family transcriptional regulator n=1 Tax=Crassaminicella profunda TaxID=1286698 RepID=UPI001CA6516B|nr:AraC family transcriptional regulator [Crassaminicella profunda]QZY53821.1 AraC family transcriptional regulator [Crassaminicella profunda]
MGKSNHSKKGNIKFSTISDLNDLQIVYGEDVTNAFPLHIHKRICIGTIRKGRGILFHKGEEHILEKGSVYFINSQEVHLIRALDENGFNHLVFSFREDVFESMFKRKINFKYSSVLDQEVSNELIKLYKVIEELDALLKKEYDLVMVLSKIISLYGENMKELDRDKGKIHIDMKKICRYIEENYIENFTLGELANISKISKFHFSRMFKKEIGISPYNYQIQIRIKNAQKLLLKRKNIASVAYESGFVDQSHFTKFFKKIVGITPAQYVKMNKIIK